MTIEDLAAGIQSEDASVRTRAWQQAGDTGAAGVEVLIPLTQSEDQEVARAATRGLWALVRHSGRPGAAGERGAACAALIPHLATVGDDQLRRDMVWMLSEIAADGDVPMLSPYLSDAAVREDIRCALERIPGQASVTALREALASADEDFKASLAQGLRARGEVVDGIPCKKLVPVRSTSVEVGDRE